MKTMYSQCGDYLIPDLVLHKADQQPIGKYGRMRKRYLKEHRPVLYFNMLLEGKLFQHLAEIDEAFIYAFRLAAKIMIDVLTDEKMKEL